MRAGARHAALLAWAAMLLLTPAAAAQTPAPGWPRFYVALDGTYRAVADPLRQTITFEEFVEDARIEAAFEARRRPTYGVTVGARIWRAVGAAVSVTQVESRSSAEVTAEIPHPFFFDRPRTIAGRTDEIERLEFAVHGQVRVFIPVRSRFDVVLFGGPSRWQVEQSVLARLDYEQSYPYDTATFVGAVLAGRRVTAWGYNGGVDVSAYFTRHVGVGALVEIATAELPLERPDGTTVDADVGGLRAGAGLRFRF